MSRKHHRARRPAATQGRHPSDVADVWVDGVRRVADGRLVDHDLAALVEASRPLAADLVTKAGLERLSQLAGPRPSSQAKPEPAARR
jgi:cytosine/adenosine deaminase-related metal-dependent hydrolase